MQTFTVTSLADDGAGDALTLREAVDLANAADGADRIEFQSDLVGNVILTEGVLTLTDDVTIDGTTANSGGPDITVSANGASRVFEVAGADVELTQLGVAGGLAEVGGGLAMDADATVTLREMTFADNAASGDAADQGGGAVYNAGGTLTIDTVQFADNDATGTAGSGGHVFTAGGDVSIVNSGFLDGTAMRAGGAIEVTGGSVTISTAVMAANQAGAAPGNGGALHVTGEATVAIEASSIFNNVAASEGGGLWNSGSGTMTVVSSVVRDNVALGDGADNGGGGIFNDGGTLTVINSGLTGNAATGAAGSGGNLMIADGDVTLLGTVVSTGTAMRAGGGIEMIDGTLGAEQVYLLSNLAGASPGNGGGFHSTGAATARFTDSVVFGNVAASEGGGLWNSATGTMIVTDTLVRGNEAAGAEADTGGGGLFNNGGTLRVTDSVLAENAATGASGSGGHVLSVDGDVELVNLLMTEGMASRAGGAVEVIDGDLLLSNVQASGNATGASPGNGGVVHSTGAASVFVENSELIDNSASAEGGALWNSATGNMVVSDSFIAGNVASGDEADQGGGGVFNNGGTLSIFDSTLQGNSADGASGSGGNVLSVAGDVLIVGVDIFDGEANRAGGGIEVIDGVLDVIDSLFDGNAAGDAPGNGGAIHSSGSASMFVGGSGFFDNFAFNEGGALWNSGAGTLDVFESVFVGNESTKGGAIFSAGGPVTIEVSEFAENASGETTTIDIDGEGGLSFSDSFLAAGEAIQGSDARDRIDLGDGNEVADGKGGDDFILGGRGDDFLIGGAGDDVLVGTFGENLLVGEEGADVFAFISTAVDGTTTIADFSDGDRIALDDRFFGLGGSRVEPRDLTGAEARAILDAGLASYDARSGELTVDVDGAGGEDGLVILQIDGGGRVDIGDFLLF